jgi:hypothetical protein
MQKRTVMWSVLAFIKKQIEGSHICSLHVGIYLSRLRLMAVVSPVFVMYIKEKQIKEFLFCEPLQTTTKEWMSSVLSWVFLRACVNAWHMWIHLHWGCFWDTKKKPRSIACVKKKALLTGTEYHTRMFCCYELTQNTEDCLDYCGSIAHFIQGCASISSPPYF